MEKSYNGGSAWTTVSNSNRSTSVSDTVAAGNKTVMYRVRAFDSGGLQSAWAYSAERTINKLPTAPPEIVTGTVVYNEYNTTVWSASKDTDGTIASYTLQRSINSGSFETVYSGPSLTFTDKTQNWGWNTVQYRVRAVDNAGGLSAWTTAPVRQVQPGRLLLTGSEPNLGRVVKSFDFKVTVTASGEFPVDGILAAVTLDGEEHLRKTVASGEEVSILIDLWFVESGEHTITGGTSGQVLAKRSAADYDTQWVDPSEGGGGSVTMEAVNAVISAVKGIHTITVTADPPEGGSVSGGGLAIEGVTCSVTAAPNTEGNFIFDGWKENDVVVSQEASYTFPVTASRNLVASFLYSQYVAGVDWWAAILPSSAYWRSVTYGDNKFVAVADNSTAAAYSSATGPAA